MQTNRQTGIHAGRQAGRLADRRAGRQADRQAGRQTNRQAGRRVMCVNQSPLRFYRQTDKRQTGCMCAVAVFTPDQGKAFCSDQRKVTGGEEGGGEGGQTGRREVKAVIDVGDYGQDKWMRNSQAPKTGRGNPMRGSPGRSRLLSGRVPWRPQRRKRSSLADAQRPFNREGHVTAKHNSS